MEKKDAFLDAFTTLAEAIHQAYPGKRQWFRLFIDNLVYKLLFGKSASQLRAMYGLGSHASLCALLPPEARQEMIRLMTCITEHLHEGYEYAAIKELVLSTEQPTPLALSLRLPARAQMQPGNRRQRRPRTRTSTPLPAQLCLPGVDE